MKGGIQDSSRRLSRTGLAIRFGGAVGLTALLLVFLTAMKLLNANRITDQTLRPVETLEEIASPPPPPLPVFEQQKPPPPPLPLLPKLKLQLENISPPLQADLSPEIDLAMLTPKFETEATAQPRPVTLSQPGSINPPLPETSPVRSSYSAGELDSRPRLLNNPSPGYPRSLLRRGIREGKVVLEVAISTTGRVSIKRVISSSDPEFTRMARSFATRSRFTVPKKNGRPVTAIYRWPLILRP